MKVAIGYLPLESNKGIPLLVQNRQFQWAKSPFTSYPVVAAYGATLLKNDGFEVYWLDGIVNGLSYEEWERKLFEIGADVLLIETKTPVVKRHWKIINKLKTVNGRLKIVLVGDHVTAEPQESFKKSKVDYVLTGGDWDFLLFSLCRHLRNGKKLEAGIWYRANDRPKNTGKFKLNHDLDKLPFIDRELTCWKLYGFDNSNYMRLPGTYTMFGRDCWWGKCSFCSWTSLYPRKGYRVMSVKRALDEVGYILENYPVREIMDDSGTFPVGSWLVEFCQGMIKRGYNKKVRINCNMRFNSGLRKGDYELMRRAGFRFLLYGLESVNQETLDKLNKNMKIEMVEPALRWVKEAGLAPHLTVMVGYPWEREKDVEKTYIFVKNLVDKGLVDSLQATIIVPYPGTELFLKSKKRGWLVSLDWDRYDMDGPVLKTKISRRKIKKFVRDFYYLALTPKFLARKTLEAVSDFDVLRYYFRFGLKFFSKLIDFR